MQHDLPKHRVRYAMKHVLITLLFCLLLPSCGRVQTVDAPRGDYRDVPILMYHSVLRDPARVGKYVVSPKQLESDIVWLLRNGYSIVTARALIEYAQGFGTLPEKPVLLTFDDGYRNNITYVLPLLEKYDCTAVVSIVGTYTQRFSDAPDPNPSYAYVSWEEAYGMALSGRFELVNHSYDMHGQRGRMGSARMPGESNAGYAAAFTADVRRLQQALAAHTRVTPDLYVYPFGIIDGDSQSLLQDMGFVGSLTCYEKSSRIAFGCPETLWGLGRFNRTGDLTTEAFMQKFGL